MILVYITTHLHFLQWGIVWNIDTFFNPSLLNPKPMISLFVLVIIVAVFVIHCIQKKNNVADFIRRDDDYNN